MIAPLICGSAGVVLQRFKHLPLDVLHTLDGGVPFSFVNLIECDFGDAICATNLLKTVDDFCFQICVDQTVYFSMWEGVSQCFKKVTDGRQHAIQIFFAVLIILDAAQRGIGPIIIGAAKYENGVDVICCKKPFIDQAMQPIDKRVCLGTIDIVVSGITDGGTGPAVVEDEI